MSLRLRKAEQEALEAVLGAEHETVSAACRSVLLTAVDLLAQRDSWVVAVHVEDPNLVLVHGPWWDERDALRAAVYMPSYPVTVHRIFPAARADGWKLREPVKAQCSACPHPRFAHYPNGCVVRISDEPGTVRACGCTH